MNQVQQILDMARKAMLPHATRMHDSPLLFEHKTE
jgi:hypothetical protein